MKKSLLLITISLLASTLFAEVDQQKFSELHQEGFAIQIAEGVDLAYYTKNHDWCIGLGGITLTSVEETGSSKSSIMKPGVFIRKNYPLTTHVTLGIAASFGIITGEDSSGNEYEDSARFKQYFSLEYAATDRVYIMASVRSIDYETYTLNNVETTTTSLLGGSTVQFAYRF